jgi:hypothetical protein
MAGQSIHHEFTCAEVDFRYRSLVDVCNVGSRAIGRMSEFLQRSGVRNRAEDAS